MKKNEKKIEGSCFCLFVFMQVYPSMSSGVGDQTMDIKLHMEAMMGEFQRMLKSSIEPLHERIDQLENSKHPSSSSKGKESAYSNDEEEPFEGRYQADQGSKGEEMMPLKVSNSKFPPSKASRIPRRT